MAGATLLALFKNGIDVDKRIPGAPGVRPLLPNITRGEVEIFRRQVEPVDMVGCTHVALIAAKVKELAARVPDRTLTRRRARIQDAQGTAAHVFATAPPPEHIKLDKGGYFVIYIKDRTIVVEHYKYRERLQHVIEAGDERTLYWSLISSGWVTRLDHAAYLGRELTRAEFSIKHGVDFEQDGA